MNMDKLRIIVLCALLLAASLPTRVFASSGAFVVTLTQESGVIENATHIATLDDGTVLGFTYNMLSSSVPFCGAVSEQTSLTVPDSVIVGTKKLPVFQIGYGLSIGGMSMPTGIDFTNAQSVEEMTIPPTVTSIQALPPSVKILHTNGYISSLGSNEVAQNLSVLYVPQEALSSYYSDHNWYYRSLILAEGAEPLQMVINVNHTGELEQLLLGQTDDMMKVNDLTVIGELNQLDLDVLKRLKQLTNLDLSNAIIDSIPVSFCGSSGSTAWDYTSANSFGIMESVYLPSVSSIGGNAFAGCRKLKAMTIYAYNPPQLGTNALAEVSNDIVIYVPAQSVNLYKSDAQWRTFNIKPIQANTHSLIVELPDNINLADYANLWLEVSKNEGGVPTHYVITNRRLYTFNNIIGNSVWNVTLRNERGDVFGRIDNVEVGAEDVAVKLTGLLQPQEIAMKVVDSEGNDVTAQVEITWSDTEGKYIAQGWRLRQLPEGLSVNYTVTLPQELAMSHNTPTTSNYTVNNGDNSMVCTLEPIEQFAIQGRVKDEASGLPIDDVKITIIQTFNGKYKKNISANTNEDGIFQIDIAAVRTTLNFSHNGYYSKSISIDGILEEQDSVVLHNVKLKKIAGKPVKMSFSHIIVNVNDGKLDTLNWYNDLQNLTYSLHNTTKNKAVNNFSIQYPNIVIQDDLDDGDELRITVSHLGNAFTPTVCTATIIDQSASAEIVIKDNGALVSTFAGTDNAAVTGMLYDANGKLLKSYDYIGNRLVVNNLPDGNYTMITMGKNPLYNTIYDLNQLEQNGLTEGKDYVGNSFVAISGSVSQIAIENVPLFDDSRLRYTTDATTLTVNKNTVTIGNFVTLTAKVDFKQEYASSVSNVKLLFDLPDRCSFMPNSVMVGNRSGEYSDDNGHIVVSLNSYTDRVRLSITPVAPSQMITNAFVMFDINGDTHIQPIGSAVFDAKALTLFAPSKITSTQLPVSGVAQKNSNVEIFADGTLIGQTTTLANGAWSAQCELYNPLNLTEHKIQAQVTTQDGLVLTTEAVNCKYDKHAVVVDNVKMSFYNGWLKRNVSVLFDFKSGRTDVSSYSMYTGTKFTFLVNFSSNDTTLVSDVYVNVFTDRGSIRRLSADFDKEQGCWVAADRFDNSALPINVSVDYITNIDKELYEADAEQMANEWEKMKEEFENNDIEALSAEIDSLLASDNVDYDVVDEKLAEMETLVGIRAEDVVWTNEDMELIDAINNAGSDAERDQLWNEFHDRYPVSNDFDNWQFPQRPSTETTYNFPNDSGDGSDPTVTYIPGPYPYDFPPCCWEPWPLPPDNDPNDANRDKIEINNKNGDKITLYMPGLSAATYIAEDNVGGSLNALYDLNQRYGGQYSLLLNLAGTLLKDISNLQKQLEQTKLELKIMETKPGPIDARKQKWLRDTRNKQTKQLFNTKSAKYMSSAMSGFMMGIQLSSDLTVTFENYMDWEELIGDLYTLCDYDDAKEIEAIAREYQAINKANTGKIAACNLAIGAISTAGVAAAGVSMGGTLLISMAALSAMCFTNWSGELAEEANKQRINEVVNMANRRCGPNSLHEPFVAKSPFAPVTPIHDPSGYVYEGVPSNRLEGVTATIFFKESTDDGNGNVQENAVKWDATEYEQRNPLLTDENGFYSWDVPQGLWQVRFEKEGYVTTQSDWLPVPPPQLDVNIAMEQYRQPEVVDAQAFENAVEVQFDKYMIAEQLNTDNIRVISGDENIEGSVSLLDGEVNSAGVELASRIRFNASEPFSGNTVMLLVDKKVQSYNWICMADDFERTLPIALEVKAISCEPELTFNYGENGTLNVICTPSYAAAGKTLNISVSSPDIVGVQSMNVLLDSEGKAEVALRGKLPGTAAVIVSVNGIRLSATALVNVERVQKNKAGIPMANIVTGSTVARGTEIWLQSSTPDAVIYYTTDGSCPCDENSSRMEYDGTPIIVESNITIIAMAVAEGLEDSNIAEFTYTVSETTSTTQTDSEEDIAIYPVPVNSTLYVNSKHGIITEVAIICLNGAKAIIKQCHSNLVSVDMNSLPQGIYIVRTTTGLDRKVQYCRVLKGK